ncbi:MAG TPA: glycosyltransferase [Pseudonocardiaceae bacterium]|jgi:N-glycosyltransferase|nr:glycosyltransferase [Pseudonocardiaceae bacterium]
MGKTMRVLCTVNASPSHARKFIPIARALLNAGHEVLFVTSEATARALRGEPFAIHTALPDTIYQWTWMMLAAGTEADAAGGTPRMPASDETELLNKAFAAKGWREQFVRAIDIARSYRPDLLLRDDFDCVGYVTAEALGVPHVTMSGGTTNPLDPRRLADPLAAHGPKFGVGTSGHGLYGYGRVDHVPAQYDFTKYEWPRTLRFRQPVLTRPGESLPSWIVDLPATRPLVFAAVGTALPVQIELQRDGVRLPTSLDPHVRLRLVLDALSQLDCVAVVATGGIDVSDLPRADHVHVCDYVPQPLVLEVADLFLTHGGYNGIREALRSGVPMVVHPQWADQPHNAARVAELGLGVAIEDPDVNDVLKACDGVLADPAFRTRARAARKHMLALPEVSSAPQAFEQLLARQ